MTFRHLLQLPQHVSIPQLEDVRVSRANKTNWSNLKAATNGNEHLTCNKFMYWPLFPFIGKSTLDTSEDMRLKIRPVKEEISRLEGISVILILMKILICKWKWLTPHRQTSEWPRKWENGAFQVLLIWKMEDSESNFKVMCYACMFWCFSAVQR